MPYDQDNPLRLAMWSPPRARSTMMMRCFEAMGCAVYDEPFYPYWLRTLNKTDDPGYAETMAAHETDWRKIVPMILGPVPEGRSIYYQKHMAIHMLEEVDLSWMNQMCNCFLIRHPAEVINSMKKKRVITAEMVGIPQLVRIFNLAKNIWGGIPPVIDANDVLENPEEVLRAFCARVGMPKPDFPLSWAPGKHPYDGAWADAWYSEVYGTTGLGAYSPKPQVVESHHQSVLEECMAVYQELFKYRITGDS